jgi:hypothetical protein
MTTTTLSHQALLRAGSNVNNCTVAERLSSDFLVDGVSLLSVVVEAHVGHADFMGCFVIGFADQNEQSKARLLLRGPEKLTGDRVLLYLCPECVDIGCGAYSVQIQESDEHFIWDLFAYENGYEEPRIIKGIGPFTLEKQSYEATIIDASAL